VRQLRARFFRFAASLATSFAAPIIDRCAASGSLRPLLVTVDDLPIAAPASIATWTRTHHAIPAALAKHRFRPWDS
jgi:hypothetical protein